MADFQYKHGDQPLEGFTVVRGVGRGGFGEVYYAHSDSGREVAIKAVQGYEQIELRGVSQCMNLKSPYLVTIFDVKHNQQDKPFVIMEYVAGASLRDLLEESPSGLGTQKAAFFLRELAKGLTYLHDRGIVHRDLKPGNIFYEDGYVKIGDYGLSKAMSTSKHYSQTITVGTVHYMAPEIGKGQYDRSIDIYALGVMLYEMLTGQVPFFGASQSEILMKHLVDEPDVGGIEEPFASVIKKAMAKDPADRYQSVQEMVEAIFGEEHIRNSVSHFRPESLSIAAQRAMQKAAVGVGGSSGEVPGQIRAHRTQDAGSSDVWQEFGTWADSVGARLSGVRDRILRRRADFHQRRADFRRRRAEFHQRLTGAAKTDAINDPLSRQQRKTLAIIAAAVITLGTAFLAPQGQILHERPVPIFFGRGNEGFILLYIFLMITGGWFGIALARFRLLPKLDRESGIIHRLAFGGLGSVFCFLLSEILLISSPKLAPEPAIAMTYSSICATLFLMGWYTHTAADRRQRVSLGPAILAGAIGYILAMLLDGMSVVAAGVSAGIALCVQVIAPFDPQAFGQPGQATQDQQAGAAAEPAGAGLGAAAGATPAAQPQPAGRPQHPQAAIASQLYTVPPYVRALALICSLVLLGIGLTLLIAVAFNRPGDPEFPFAVGLGIGSLMFSVFFLCWTLKSSFRSWWGSCIKPFLMLLCVQSVLVSAMFLGFAQMRGDEEYVAVFFLVFPTILFLVMAFIPNRAAEAVFGSIPPIPIPKLSLTGQPRHNVSTRLRLWTMLLALGGFLGPCGLHRFYAGKIGTGVLWLVTFGLFYIGQIIDIIMIACGLFEDRDGKPIVVWQSFDELKHPSSPAYDVAAAKKSPAPPAPQARQPIDGKPQAEQQADVSAPPSLTDSRIRQAQRFNPTAAVLSIMGGFLVLVAFLLGLFTALHIPEAVGAGIPDRQMADELKDLFGYAGWPQLVGRIVNTSSILLMLVAATFLIVGRRRHGAAHAFRAVLGVIGLLVTLNWLHIALNPIDWFVIEGMIHSERIGPAIELALNMVRQEVAAAAGVTFLISVILMAWPARRQLNEPAAIEEEGV